MLSLTGCSAQTSDVDLDGEVIEMAGGISAIATAIIVEGGLKWKGIFVEQFVLSVRTVHKVLDRR